MKCEFHVAPDPSWRGSAHAPSVGWCKTHQRRSDVCQHVEQEVAIEREACAKIAEAYGVESSGWGYEEEAERCNKIAAAIRARGQTTTE